MTAVKTEAKPNGLAFSWTKAAMVRRAFNAGPRLKSDRTFDDLEDAVLEAYTEFRDMRRRMKNADLSARDTRAAFVLMTAHFQGPPINAGVALLIPIPDTIKGLPELLKEAERAAGKNEMVPLGVVFWQRDRDERAKEANPVWVQSWRVDPRWQRAANAARDEFRDQDGRLDGPLAATFEEDQR